MLSFDIYPANALSDVEQLREPLESAIRNPVTHDVATADVDDTMSAVEAVMRGESERYYAIALTSGQKALGVMGLQSPEETMRGYTSTTNPAEIINAYVIASERGTGIGRALVSHLETKALELGHTELIVNSGIRYRRSGWPFWNRMYGDSVATAKDYYGPRFDAAVWRKLLIDTA